ncbi:MAG: class II aldolase/adducin family protein [Rhodoferax sp.]|nr:class II aldolase/adducin family protein [Rhodoferax sp.]MCB2039689.1 class II aldolase/adducin family protein [Rhodoferax sp.]
MPRSDTPSCPSATPVTGIPHDMHPEEWSARVELAGCYRLFAMLGWTELIYNHITLRLPATVTGSEIQFLINPFGLHYNEVCASNLVRIDAQGRILDASAHPVNPAGFTLHAAIHAGIEDAHCIMHTHTTAGVAVASLDAGLLQSNFYTAQLDGMVASHDFEGITVHDDEGPRIVRSIGGRPAVILRNHGLLAWGRSIPQAFAFLWTLQRACEIQLATMSMGAPRLIPAAVAHKSTQDTLTFNPGHWRGELVFQALMRQVDRLDAGYRN